MSGALATVEAPARAVVVEPPGVEAPKQKDGGKAVKQFTAMVEAAQVGKNSSTEALAGIAGWQVLGRTNADLEVRQRQVTKLLQEKKIPETKALEYNQKIGELAKKIHTAIIPSLQRLDAIAMADETTGTPNTFLRDLNYHSLKAEIKQLEGSQALEDVARLREIQTYLTEAEKERGGMAPEDDQLVEFALKLAGAKELPKEFKDDPLRFINKIFQKDLPAINKSPKLRLQLAERLGIDADALTALVSAYDQGVGLEREMGVLGEAIDQDDPDAKKSEKAFKKVNMVGGIFGLFLALPAYLAYLSFQKESQAGPQQG